MDIFELVRLIAVTRIALSKARVRLAAGRTRFSCEGQVLCFFAGANSIFYGDKLLTAKNPAADMDVDASARARLAASGGDAFVTVATHEGGDFVISRSEELRFESTSSSPFAMKSWELGVNKNRNRRDYGLEKIFYRIRCSVWFYLRVWIPLARNAYARRV